MLGTGRDAPDFRIHSLTRDGMPERQPIDTRRWGGPSCFASIVILLPYDFVNTTQKSKPQKIATQNQYVQRQYLAFE